MKLNLLFVFACVSFGVGAQEIPYNRNFDLNQRLPAIEKFKANINRVTFIEQSSLNSKYYCEEFSIRPPEQRDWRAVVLSELSPSKFPKLFETDVKLGAAVDIKKYCPNYSNLKEEQKKIILLRILDAMVFFESTCNINARAKGPNGTAYGIFQLHYGREDDYASYCRRFDSKNPIRSIVCALDMLHDQIERAQRIFFSGSYWDVLRPNGQSKKATRIANHIWYYPLCQPPRRPVS